ncbi:unnamed protein product, partial [Discosporangium mesarthrocarpum]
GIPFGSALPGVRDGIVNGTIEEAYVAFMVSLTILEKTLYSIYYRLRDDSKSTLILKDLIATVELAEALPTEMVALLRLLLLPLGFNVRNLVWHGFLTPRELPRDVPALVLMITLDLA